MNRVAAVVATFCLNWNHHLI